MAYIMDVGIQLGAAKIGLAATLRIQLINSDGTDNGVAIENDPPTSIITEIGTGNYLWHYEEFPDNLRGGIKIYDVGDPIDTLAFTAVNPEDIETSQSRGKIGITVGRSDANFIVYDNNVYDSLEVPEVVIRTGVK